MIKDFSLVCLAVNDLDAAVQDFQEMFSLEVLEWNDSEQVENRNAILSLGNSRLELMTLRTGEEQLATYLKEKDEGIYLIGIEVADMDAAIQQIKENGGRVFRDERLADGRRAAFVHPRDTHGVMVELLQGAPGKAPVPPIPSGSSGVIKKLDLHCIIVRDIQKAVDDWGRLFGTSVETWHEGEELGNKNAMVPIGSQGAYLEIMTPRTGDEPWARFLDERGETTFLIGVEVDDMDKVIERVRGSGRRVVGEHTYKNGSRQAMVHPRDAHGVMIELLQPAPGTV